MAGGIKISTDAGLALGGLATLGIISVSEGANTVGSVLAGAGIAIPTLGPYRDKQQNKPATYSITVPASVNQSSLNYQPVGTLVTDENDFTLQGAGLKTQSQGSKIYVFDAVLIAQHFSSLEATNHPLQSGYNISDHAILRQPDLILEIGMSDAMAEFTSGMWSTNGSKSVSAFQVLKTLQANRTLLTLATRQQTYENMLLMDISSEETNSTISGLRANLRFKQMLIVDVATITTTSRPQATDQTPQASLQSNDVPITIIQQHEVTNLPAGNSNSVVNQFGVPAGGLFSSNNVSGGQ